MGWGDPQSSEKEAKTYYLGICISAENCLEMKDIGPRGAKIMSLVGPPILGSANASVKIRNILINFSKNPLEFLLKFNFLNLHPITGVAEYFDKKKFATHRSQICSDCCQEITI